MDASTNTDLSSTKDACTNTHTNFSFLKNATRNHHGEVSSPLPDYNDADPTRVNVRGFKWSLNMYENVATGLNVFALLSSICVVGTSGNALSIYHKTTTGPDFGLPLWPQDFTLRPTEAFVGSGTVMLVLSFVSLYVTLMWQYHSKLRARPFGLSIVTYTCAIFSLICAITSVGIFYHNNTSNKWTMQSWSCQWRDVNMSASPHWDKLCGQSKASLYLCILMIPMALLTAAGVSLGARQTENQRKGAMAQEVVTKEKLEVLEDGSF